MEKTHTVTSERDEVPRQQETYLHLHLLEVNQLIFVVSFELINIQFQFQKWN